MEIATSKSLSRLAQLALVGTATTFAWIVLSLLLGLGSGEAHADENDPGGNGLLGAVTSLVDRTAATATGTVTAVTGSVSGVVNTAVAVAPAPAQQPVREVVQTVGTVVIAVTAPVTDVVSGGVVGAVTEPVVDIVTQVPVVGGVVTGIGLDDAVTDLTTTVDDTLDEVAGAVLEVGETVGQPGAGIPVVPVLPVLPGSPATPALLDHTDATGAAQFALVPAIGDAAAILTSSRAFTAASLHGTAGNRALAPVHGTPAVWSSTSSGGPGPLSPAGGLCPPSATATGPGASGLGAWALLALGPFVAHRAWVRRAGPEDEHAPAAPAGSTDVSPD